MPGFNGTGPRGEGPLTGGGRGFCAVNLTDQDVMPSTGRSFSGRGRGRGNRNCFYATGLPGWMRTEKVTPFVCARGKQASDGFGETVSKDEELDILKNQADFLKNKLENTQARIQDLEGKKGAN